MADKLQFVGHPSRGAMFVNNGAGASAAPQRVCNVTTRVTISERPT